jgi:hypothetical protein
MLIYLNLNIFFTFDLVNQNFIVKFKIIKKWNRRFMKTKKEI